MLDRFLRAFCTAFLTTYLVVMGVTRDQLDACWPHAGPPLTESPADEPLDPINEFGLLP